MSVPPQLAQLIGAWGGTNRLWLAPDQPPHRSPTSAAVALAAQGYFLTISYAWEHDGRAQDGVILVSETAHQNVVRGVWIDSFHTGDGFMTLEGAASGAGEVSLQGSYAAPPGPDWGWQIAIRSDGDEFRIVMHNLPPEGAAALAVEATYERVKPM